MMANNIIENEIPPNARLVQWAKEFLNENTFPTAKEIAAAQAGLKRNEALRAKNERLLEWNMNAPLMNVMVRTPDRYEEAVKSCKLQFDSFFGDLDKQNEKLNAVIALAEQRKYAENILQRQDMAEQMGMIETTTEQSKPIQPVTRKRVMIMPTVLIEQTKRIHAQKQYQ